MSARSRTQRSHGHAGPFAAATRNDRVAACARTVSRADRAAHRAPADARARARTAAAVGSAEHFRTARDTDALSRRRARFACAARSARTSAPIGSAGTTRTRAVAHARPGLAARVRRTLRRQGHRQRRDHDRAPDAGAQVVLRAAGRQHGAAVAADTSVEAVAPRSQYAERQAGASGQRVHRGVQGAQRGLGRSPECVAGGDDEQVDTATAEQQRRRFRLDPNCVLAGSRTAADHGQRDREPRGGGDRRWHRGRAF